MVTANWLFPLRFKRNKKNINEISYDNLYNKTTIKENLKCDEFSFFYKAFYENRIDNFSSSILGNFNKIGYHSI